MIINAEALARLYTAFSAVFTEAGASVKSPPGPLPTGTLRSISPRISLSESGKSSAFSEVSTAIMPQPISTPTAAGMIAPLVGITEPTVAPMPKCTSGITAMWL